MDYSKLELMSTETLEALRDKCADVLRSRAGVAIGRGRVAWFLDRTGTKRYIRIDRINQKTIGGKEVDAETHSPLSTVWKVSPQMLNPVVDKVEEAARLAIVAKKREAEQKMKALVTQADKPIEYGDEAW